MIIIYLYKISKKQNLFSILNHNVSLMITKVYESLQNTSSKNHIIIIFFFNILFLNYSFIIRYTSQLLCFCTIGIIISLFFESPKKLSYLPNISLLFCKKELKPTKKLNKITKQKCFSFKTITISSIIIVLLFINIDFLENLYEPKQHLSLLKEVAKFLKNPKNYPIVPLLSFRLNDEKIICNVGLGCESESIGQGRSYVDKNINISLCFFSRSLSYSGDGGVIYVNGGSYSMNVNYSMFYYCVCSNYGGAIYFSSPNSYLRMICANSCSCGASSRYHFAYLSASPVNQVEYLSVSNCSHTTSGYLSIHLESGYQRVDNTNSSMNNAERVSGIGIIYPSSFTSSHCTFSNNKVSDSICMLFYSTSGIISMSYANIVHNNSPSWGVVHVEEAGPRKMMYCIFKKNQNTLFCVWSGSIEVSHSYISHSGSFSSSTAVSTSNNNSFTNTITYQLQFFNSLHCNADIPLFPSMIATLARTQTMFPSRTATQANTLIETPFKTLNDTPMNTHEETLMKTPEETLMKTPEESPMNTPEDTVMNTPEDTPINTIDQTIRDTPRETIPRTYAEFMCTNQMANWREINVVFSFAFLYPVIILMIS